MATPASGTISMDDMRSEITRGASSISMSEVRTRYGGSGAISFSDLYAAEGWVQTNGQYVAKYFTFVGWRDDAIAYPCGSITPDEGNGQIVIVTGANIAGFSRTVGVGNTNLNMSGSVTGYRAQDIIRFVAANAETTFTSTSNTTGTVPYSVANSGTIHCMVQF